MAVVSKSSRSRAGLVIGLVVAAAGVAGTFLISHAGTSNQPSTTTIVVATSDIAAATPITRSMLGTESVPATSIPPGSFSDPSTLVGQLPQVPISKGTIVVSSDFVTTVGAQSTSAPGGVAAPAASGFVLKDGYVAIAMPVDPEVAVGYYIQPHDHVDFIVGAGPTSGGPSSSLRYGFQDVEVLAVGGNAGSGVAGDSRQDGLLVVALPRRQAEELAIMIADPQHAPMTVVRLVLRPKDSYGKGALNSGSDSPFTGADPSDPTVTAATLNSMFR